MRDLVVFIVEDDPIFGTLLEHSIKLNEDYSVYSKYRNN